MKIIRLTSLLIAPLAGLLLYSSAGAQTSGAMPHDEHQHGSHAKEAGSSVGRAGDPSKVTRTVTVDMNDSMRFNPASISVKQGEVLRFVVRNSGKLKHEMVIGSVTDLQEHAKMMQKFPEMEHAEPNQVTLQPGKTGNIIWQFDTAGNVEFACLQPGHFEAGMKGVVKVANK